MKRFNLAVSILAVVVAVAFLACGGPAEPTAVPSPVASATPAPAPTPDPCAVTGLDITGRIGNVPAYSFPLNQFVTLDADYRDADQEAAAKAECPSLRSVEQWAIIEGHGDLFGNLSGTEVVLVAAEPGNFIVRANAYDRTRSVIVDGEWKGRAKVEGEALSRFDSASLARSAGFPVLLASR